MLQNHAVSPQASTTTREDWYTLHLLNNLLSYKSLLFYLKVHSNLYQSILFPIATDPCFSKVSLLKGNQFGKSKHILSVASLIK